MNDPLEPKRKLRTNSKPYDRAPQAPKPTQPAHKSSAKPTESTCHSNLTLGDWLKVFKFYDSHSGIKQGNVVKHFATCCEGLETIHPVFSAYLVNMTVFPDYEWDTNCLERSSDLSRRVPVPVPIMKQAPRRIQQQRLNGALLEYSIGSVTTNAAALLAKYSMLEKLGNLRCDAHLNGTRIHQENRIFQLAAHSSASVGSFGRL
ncbi:hypothetical protein C8J56DRAFT_1098410 [Mycena floridula]|nr:hypothetical protein C8J56DRAFT_1098410 [Mycena floridula]